MFADTGRAGVSKQEFLDASAAAKHCGFKLNTFKLWNRAGFIPQQNPSNGWTRDQLDSALEKITRLGFGIFAPAKASYITIPNCQRLPRRLVDGTTRWHMRHRISGRPLPADWKAPEFAAAVIECERQIGSFGPATSRTEIAGRVAAPSIVSEPRPVRPPFEKSKESSQIIFPNSSSSELLTTEELIARYRGLISEGTLRNHRSRKTGPPYIVVMRQVFYPLPLLLLWEKANMQMCGLPEFPFTIQPED
jgi:hypothetical protein